MKSGGFLKKAVLLSLIVCLMQVMVAAAAYAVPIPSAEFTYSAKLDEARSAASGKNWWSYHLTVYNTADQANPGEDVSALLLYYFEIAVADGGSFIGRSLPEGWISFSAPSWDNETIYPFTPDLMADFGYEIAAGTSLQGYHFLLDYNVATLPVNVLFWNPDGEPLFLTALAREAAPVPEPSTVFLLLTGVAGLVVAANRRRT